MWPDARAVRPYNDKKANLLLLGKRLAFFACEYMKDYRPFKEDFFKIIDFCHYLHEEGYDLMKL